MHGAAEAADLHLFVDAALLGGVAAVCAGGEAALEEGDGVGVAVVFGNCDGGPILAFVGGTDHVNLGAVLDEAAADFGVAVRA